MLNLIITSFGLMGLGLAIPTSWPPASSCSKSTSANANFDDLTGTPGVALTPIPAGYMGLLFQGFDLLTVVQTPVGVGVAPHSGSNSAVSDVLTTTTAGSAEWTTNYSGSKVKTFSPKSFYYGCALQQKAAAEPTACNIAITGFAKGDNTAEAVQVASQEFSYNPTTSTGIQQQAQGIFNSQFKDLQYVLIQYTLPGGLAGANPDLGLNIDDVKYDYCSY